jgi:hypothetical protein
MLGNYLVDSRVALSSIELVSYNSVLVFVSCTSKQQYACVFSPPPPKAGRYDFSPSSSANAKFSNSGSPRDFSDDDDNDDDNDDEHQSK